MTLLVVLVCVAALLAAGRWWAKPRFRPERGKLRLDRPPRDDPRRETVNLVGIPAPIDCLKLGVLFLGVPGTGKTVALTRLGRSYWRRAAREVRLDFKNEAYPQLEKDLPKDRPIWQMNVFDRHPTVASLNLAETFTNFALAHRLGYALVSDLKGDHQPFFRNAARALVVAVVELLARRRAEAQRPWRLRDVLAVASAREVLEAVMGTDPDARDCYAQFMHHGDSAKDVFSTLHGCLSRFKAYAVADFAVARQVSLREFMGSRGVMILGVDPEIMKVQLPLYQLLMHLVVEASLLRQLPGDRTVLCLDEIAMLEEVGDLVVTACATGRSSNLAILAATQSLSLLRHRLGKENEESLRALLQTVVAFQLRDPEDARWVAELVGKYEGVVWKPSGVPNSPTWSADVVERYLVHPQEVMRLPLAGGPGGRVACCVASSTLGSLRVEESFAKAVDGLEPPGSYEYRRRDLSAMGLGPFGEEDCKALGIPLSNQLVSVLSERKKK